MSTTVVVPDRATPGLSRWDYQEAHTSTSKADLWFALELAETPAEVDQAAHLSLVLFDVAGTMRGFTEHGRTWPALHQLVHQARMRVDGFAPQARAMSERLNEISAEATRTGKQRRARDRKDRDAQIERIGYVNANPPTS